MVAGAGFVGSGSGSGRRSPGRLGRSVHRPQPIAAIGLVVGLLVVIGVVVKVFDLKQKRESEAVQLQAQLSDALLREPSLAGLPLTPTVHVPMWRGTPATIELMGRVPTPELKDTPSIRRSDHGTRRVTPACARGGGPCRKARGGHCTRRTSRL